MKFNRQHYLENIQKLFKLSTPIFIAQLSMSGMGLSDIIMAGLVSDNDVSALAVSNSIYFPLFLFVIGVIYAITPIVSYLNGSGQSELIAQQIRQGYWIVFTLSIPLIIIFTHSHWILDFMETPPDFSIKSQHYLTIMAIGVIPALLMVNLRCLNDGLSTTKPAMFITFIGLLVNIILNYILIFGKFGFPEMGAVGCGVATTIVNWVMFLLLLHYCYTTPSQKDIHLFDKWFERPNRAILCKIIRLGLPIAFATFTEVMLFSASALLLSPLGAQVVASHQVALQTSSLFFMIPFSFGIGVSIMVGQALGRKDVEEAKYLSYYAIGTALILASITAVIIILFSHWIPYLFTQNEVSVAMASYLLIFAAIYQLPDAVQAVCNGILRGYKHTRSITYITIFCYWGIGMPFGYILSRTNWIVEPLGAKGFWMMFCVSLLIVAGLFVYQMRKIQRIPANELIDKLENMK
ncbi:MULTISPECIES: MATE family efflux transporter [Pasteurellaceae]|uniref:Multidrug-efflux transporter n=1 Tax=Pasteurella atlantica TaxID=2827233 RepID=A0AAW8CML2_9PAST|nr:MATE family efflux transporter [Pasteurella atlantica]MBR0572833.1 MATE family efflux transporter [Pasteurella atlantica]MDP8038762.1 MATE family efflux transporter [Pasteurella atlantica]MDP8040853.1 MATE family efflux transporter [Pasteurella atlantica]MDP8042973.1 MATE family efflux transporter [Pasteurella atlantica]MDP8045060.1 MATE family efflux transporter [Pasteurella atlantica]